MAGHIGLEGNDANFGAICFIGGILCPEISQERSQARATARRSHEDGQML